MKALYYENQDVWNSEDFYYLHRCLHRLFCYYEKNADEIKNLDTGKMSENTRVLIYCIIKYYGLDILFDMYDNLKPLKETKPLKEPLVLDNEPLPEDNIYRRMNVLY